ncbi:MAG: DUF5658 family protein [Promethearchaeota archaeon]
MKNEKLVFLINNFFVISYIFLKITDVITTFYWISKNNFQELNPFATQIIQNPILLIILFIGLIISLFMFNSLIYFKINYNCIQELFLIGIIFINIVGIWVLMENYYTIISVV